jgi:hypothetical protein
MNDSYTVLWTDDRCRWLKEHGATGQPLRVLFGGGHQSAPSFTRFGVRPGDFIYPVRVHRTILHVIARMRVREIIPVGDYLLHHLDCPDVDLTRHLYEGSRSRGGVGEIQQDASAVSLPAPATGPSGLASAPRSTN